MSSNKIRKAAKGKINPVPVEFSQISPVLQEKTIKHVSTIFDCNDSQYLQFVKKRIVKGTERTNKPAKVVIIGAFIGSNWIAANAASLDDKT